MSERKTTEIKLRVTPEEKLRWQTAAEKQAVALSELIRQTMNGLVQSDAQKAQFPIVSHPFVPEGYVVIKNVTESVGDSHSTSGVPTDGDAVSNTTDRGCKSFWKGCPDGKCVCDNWITEDTVKATIEIQPWKYEARSSG